MSRHAQIRRLRQTFAGLPERARLTWEYHGPKEVARRAVTFPLRLTPWGARRGMAPRMSDPTAGAYQWYRRSARPVCVVIPHYGPTALVEQAIRSIRKTTDKRLVRIVVADDHSPPEHRAALLRLRDVHVIFGERQVGFAANANRGLREVRPDEDAVLLNSDVIAHAGWLERLQYTARRWPRQRNGIVGPKLLYEDGTIQSAGTIRNPGAPEWFDHAHRFKPEDHPQANVMQPYLAMTGAALYIRRDVLDEVGLLDEGYGMAYEDVDYCLRAWEAGFRVVFSPFATLTHLESRTRGTEQGERELASQRRFWARWGTWLDERRVHGDDGRLRIIYVTEDTGIGGGHRVIYQHLNGLAARGHDCELWTLAPPPDWFDLHVPTRTFSDYLALRDALRDEDAIKVATWWATAPWVWEASVTRGIGAYFVQDIETSYYENAERQTEVLASYRPEFRYLTTSQWVQERLRGLGHQAVAVPPGLDLDRFYPLGRERHGAAVLTLGRSNPLKNLPLTLEAYDRLREPRPALWLFGIEPELGAERGAAYHVAPSDAEVNELLNTCTVFVQTSRHEGFCLPILEAMSTGAAVVCTDAHGNRDFCRDGENCLMPEPTPQAVAAALQRVLDDPELRARLAAGGQETALRYDWQRLLDDLAVFFERLAGERSAVVA